MITLLQIQRKFRCAKTLSVRPVLWSRYVEYDEKSGLPIVKHNGRYNFHFEFIVFICQFYSELFGLQNKDFVWEPKLKLYRKIN